MEIIHAEGSTNKITVTKMLADKFKEDGCEVTEKKAFCERHVNYVVDLFIKHPDDSRTAIDIIDGTRNMSVFQRRHMEATAEFLSSVGIQHLVVRTNLKSSSSLAPAESLHK